MSNRCALPPVVLVSLLIVTFGATSLADEVVLYLPDHPQGGQAQTMADDGFFAFSSDLFNQQGFYSSDELGTTFTSAPDHSLRAGFSTHGGITGAAIHPDAPVLDSIAGFSISFDLAIDSESHIDRDDNGDEINDRGGFVVIVIGEDQQGIEIAFWEDEIWAYEGGEEPELFTHAEGSPQSKESMRELRSYELTVFNGGYVLKVGGESILEGPLRDYTSWPGLEIPFLGTFDPYEVPNILFLGDDTSSAQSTARIGRIAVELDLDLTSPPDVPTDLTMVRIDAATFQLSWSSTPESDVSVRSSDDLIEWLEVEQVTADDAGRGRFTSQFSARSGYYRIEPVD
ncbi:MAG: hypothetical protein KDN22_15685 [Verrucomicrobiae bacterium]|nr:hypothetical protein [Verrucomicrobiae bacterium]